MRAHVRNFLTLEEYRARGDAAGCARVLAGKIIGECVPCFRVHESGDFYSEFQIDVWARVARALPEIKFWAYTRTYWLNYGPLVELPNWQHYFSIDDDNFEAVLKTRASLSYGHKIKLAEISPTGIDSAKYITRSTGFTCPAGKGQALDGVPGACLRCKLCWSGKCRKSPVFIKH
ncbi:MAG: hypothetical protein D6694_07205 [Gammaproteobacteria bacterium]|nr:MAG: hypothetical protein D6694_07205 [Gammaproteobacteria bacterium]